MIKGSQELSATGLKDTTDIGLSNVLVVREATERKNCAQELFEGVKGGSSELSSGKAPPPPVFSEELISITNHR